MLIVVGWKLLVKPEEFLTEIKLGDTGVNLEIPDAFRARGKFGYACFGEIIQISEEILKEKDTIEKMGIKVGSKVIFDRQVGAYVKIDKKDYRLIQPEDVLAVVENEDETVEEQLRKQALEIDKEQAKMEAETKQRIKDGNPLL